MTDHALKHLIEAADRAISTEDFDTLMAFYAEDATLVVQPGLIATGKAQIRKAFDAIADHFNHRVTVTQGEMKIVEGGDTALVLMETMVTTGGQDGEEETMQRRATYVFRKVEDRWLCVIDNSYGTALLDAG